MLFALLLAHGCAGPGRGEGASAPTTPPPEAPTSGPAPATPDAAATPASTQPIRAVDFANFTYPWPEVQRGRVGERSFTLTDGVRIGEVGPGGRARVWSLYYNSTEYADLSGDGVEEAVVLLHVLPTNEVSGYGIYVFEIDRRRPRFVGCLLASDRGPGAFRKVAAENGELVVELAGADQVPGRTIDPLAQSAPTPEPISRSRFAVRAHTLRFVGRDTLMPKP